MATTKRVMVGDMQIVLYTLDGRCWFSRPVLLIEARRRREKERRELREHFLKTMADEIYNLPPDTYGCGGIRL